MAFLQSRIQDTTTNDFTESKILRLYLYLATRHIIIAAEAN